MSRQLDHFISRQLDPFISRQLKVYGKVRIIRMKHLIDQIKVLRVPL